MDAGLHQLQGKAKGVKPSELVAFLEECYRERRALADRHRAVAAHVAGYDANNPYQYVINREDMHVEWLADALEALGAERPAPAAGPSLTIARGKDAWKPLVQEDVRGMQQFIDKWRPRVEQLTHARNRTMLRLMLGEMKEQVHLFNQIATGVADVLGRGNESAADRRGVVGSTRWLGD